MELFSSSYSFGLPSVQKYLARKTVMISKSVILDPADIPPPSISAFPGSITKVEFGPRSYLTKTFPLISRIRITRIASRRSRLSEVRKEDV